MHKRTIWYGRNDDDVFPIEDLVAYVKEHGHTFLVEDETVRVVARTTIDDVFISTVFLGIDHQFDDGPPLLFETMIFANAHPALDQQQWRWHTLREARDGHAFVVNYVREHIDTTHEQIEIVSIEIEEQQQ